MWDCCHDYIPQHATNHTDFPLFIPKSSEVSAVRKVGGDPVPGTKKHPFPMRTHGQIMYAFYEGHRLIPVHLSFCPIDCKKMLNWLHRAEPKDVPTLWFNFRLTNCAYPTDFNVLRHVLTL